MSSFTKPLTVTKAGPRTWRVSRAFDYYVGDPRDGDRVSVPEGFITDFASVPRPFWVILPPDGEYTQAAVVHDYLYSTRQRLRRECDRIFYEAMGVLGVPAWKRAVMYRAVRLFGWIPWNAKKDHKLAQTQKNPDKMD